VSDSVEQEVAFKIRTAPVFRCNRCGAVPIEVWTLLDPRKGKSVRIMQCSCGKESWCEDA
jgi:hypothetical protein